MASNKSDAEAINISGSLRMQSYRLLTEMERSPNTVEQNLVRYQDSLNANVLLTVQNQLFAPSGMKASYQKILQRCLPSAAAAVPAWLSESLKRLKNA